MPFVPNFTAVQIAGSLSTMRLTDTSTGTDAAITDREIRIRLADGTYLVPSGNPSDEFIAWPYAASTKDVNVLTADFAPQIILVWLDVNGDTLYTKEIAYSFTGYSEQFYYTLTQGQAADPSELMDTNYYLNKMKLRVNIDSANQAIIFASDIAAAQNCLNRAQYMIENESLFF